MANELSNRLTDNLKYYISFPQVSNHLWTNFEIFNEIHQQGIEILRVQVRWSYRDRNRPVSIDHSVIRWGELEIDSIKYC